MDVMTIRALAKVFELKDVALKFAKNIIMMNYTCRDQMLHEFLEHIKVGKKELGEDRTISEGIVLIIFLNDIEYEDETELNPLDLIFALFKSCSPMLKQILANKLFMSKLAIPFILPKFGNEPLEMCLWPLRSIILESKLNNGSCQDMSVECPCEIVSFVRIGRSSVSKSKLLNEILTDQYHNTFSNKDCPLGTSKRIISDGIVEAAWNIPSNKSKILTNTTMFLNLRGDAVSHA
ncbi:unnamed protein product [Mytilus coruscus]|uniref:Up-regulator of cell proliferation-like domain-containing protein n=1 Tax=Mytilus coruscus TaxID=42192 RepID=A0A6J8BS53_MYTCO|nr:unnamed protein product [Mytilus coruscus]